MASPCSYWWLLQHSFIGHQIEETLRAAGKSELFTLLSYPGAGHLIEPPYTPNSRASLWTVKPQKRESHPRAAFFVQPNPIFTLNVILNIMESNNNLMSCFVFPAVITLWGGHLAPHAAAQEDAWKKILDFMEHNLRR